MWVTALLGVLGAACLALAVRDILHEIREARQQRRPPKLLLPGRWDIMSSVLFASAMVTLNHGHFSWRVESVLFDVLFWFAWFVFCLTIPLSTRVGALIFAWAAERNGR